MTSCQRDGTARVTGQGSRCSSSSQQAIVPSAGLSGTTRLSRNRAGGGTTGGAGRSAGARGFTSAEAKCVSFDGPFGARFPALHPRLRNAARSVLECAELVRHSRESRLSGRFPTGRMEPTFSLPGLGTLRRVGASKPSCTTVCLRRGCWSKSAIVARYLL